MYVLWFGPYIDSCLQINKLIVPWKENMASNLLRRYDKDSESVTAQLLDEVRVLHLIFGLLFSMNRTPI